MRKGAKLLILALLILVRIKIRGAEFGFVLIWVVELLDPVVSPVAVVSVGAVDTPLRLLAVTIASTVLRMLAASMFASIGCVWANL